MSIATISIKLSPSGSVSGTLKETSFGSLGLLVDSKVTSTPLIVMLLIPASSVAVPCTVMFGLLELEPSAGVQMSVGGPSSR